MSYEIKVTIDALYTVSTLSLNMDIQMPFLNLYSERLLSRLNHIWAGTSSIRSQTTLVTVKATLTIAVLGHLSMSTLDTTVINDGSVVESHLRSDIVLAIITGKALTRDENIEEARDDKGTDDEEEESITVLGRVVVEKGARKREANSVRVNCL